MKVFWRTDWCLGVVVVIAIALFKIDPGYIYITKLLDLAGKSAPPAPRPGDPAQSVSGPGFAQFNGLLQEAEQARNSDRKLADRFTPAGNVVPMMLFEPGVPQRTASVTGSTPPRWTSIQTPPRWTSISSPDARAW